MSIEAWAAVGAVVLGIWLAWWLWRSAEATRRELRRLRGEIAMVGTPGQWRCGCGRMQLDRASIVADGAGMLHGRPCEPDVELLMGDL